MSAKDWQWFCPYCVHWYIARVRAPPWIQLGCASYGGDPHQVRALRMPLFPSGGPCIPGIPCFPDSEAGRPSAGGPILPPARMELFLPLAEGYTAQTWAKARMIVDTPLSPSPFLCIETWKDTLGRLILRETTPLFLYWPDS